jgi:hypothetical protein
MFIHNIPVFFITSTLHVGCQNLTIHCTYVQKNTNLNLKWSKYNMTYSMQEALNSKQLLHKREKQSAKKYNLKHWTTLKALLQVSFFCVICYRHYKICFLLLQQPSVCPTLLLNSTYRYDMSFFLLLLMNNLKISEQKAVHYNKYPGNYIQYK